VPDVDVSVEDAAALCCSNSCKRLAMGLHNYDERIHVRVSGMGVNLLL
jgi:hypothetical protein